MQLSISKLFSAFVALSMAAISGVVCAEETLCKSNENIYFSCRIRSGKIISLCKKKEGELEKSIIYKFGSGKRVELSFPQNVDENNEFMFNHYIRSGVDYLAISFHSGSYRYSVFRDYDESISKTPDFGVTIEDVLRPGKERTISCTSVDTDRLSEAAKGLRCDHENALGCSSIPPSHVHTPTGTR